MTIRASANTDAAAIANIYNFYILNSTVSFEEEPVSCEEMAHRIADVTTSSLPWLVAEVDNQIIGYAYATKWKARTAYKYSVEISVYLDHAHIGKGIGTKLYSALFETLKITRVNAVIGGIALPNPASIALHEAFGMEKVAHFKRIGYKFGKWIDVAYWQKELNINAAYN